MTADHALGVAILIPFLGFWAVMLSGSKPNLRDSLMVACAVLTCVVVFQLFPFASPAVVAPSLRLFPVLPGIDLAFSLEPLGMLYAAVASGLWVLTSLYSIGYMREHHEQNQTRFFGCFALSISAALGIAFAANLFTLFLFYELLTFCTYPLITHHGTDQAVRAGRVYLGVLVSTSVVGLLFAVLWTWHIAGTTEFALGGILAGKADPAVLPILLALFAFGTGKAALMPFHRWLPNAMVAPTPVSALLHAVAVVKAGVFTVLKVVVYVFGLDLLTNTPSTGWLCYVAAFTLLVSGAIAVTKDNLKTRLAYSTISHLSYIVLGAALAAPSSVLGGGLHVAMHAFGKITLFFCAGAIYVTAHKTSVSELDGLGRKMPITMGAFFLASLSLIGMPPFGGMWSKWHLALGAAQSGHQPFVFVFMASSVLSIAYLMPPVIRAFFREPHDDGHPHHQQHYDAFLEDETELEGDVLSSPPPAPRPPEPAGPRWTDAPLLCLLPLCLTALGSLALFFFAEPLYLMLLPIVGGAR